MDSKEFRNDQDQLTMLVREYRALNDSLGTLENQIMTLETQYLQEDCPTWNVIRGFEGFNERSQIITRKQTLLREDRLFSLSSHSSPAMNLPMDDDIRSMASGDSSPVHRAKRSHKKKMIYGEDDYE